MARDEAIQGKPRLIFKSKKEKRLFIGCVVACIILVTMIVTMGVTMSIEDPYEYDFTAKLVDFKPPSKYYSAYLIFDNGRIIEFSGQGSITTLEIGATYEVYKHNYNIDNWRVYKVEG